MKSLSAGDQVVLMADQCLGNKIRVGNKSIMDVVGKCISGQNDFKLV